MPTTVWKGHIAFGSVAFPVKLHAAARSPNQLCSARRTLSNKVAAVNGFSRRAVSG